MPGRVVSPLDALNQFERTPAARHLTWLPQLWPENARLIATSIAGEESEALKCRGVRLVELQPLAVTAARQMAAGLCGRRQLHPEIMEALISKGLPDGRPACGSPRWLELAIQELLSLDPDDFGGAGELPGETPEQKMHALLLDVVRRPHPVMESEYGAVFERAGEIHGAAWGAGFARLIGIDRAGWCESDLRVLLPRVTGETGAAQRFAALRRSFRAHLAQRGDQAQWDFSRAQARQAVPARYLVDPGKRREVH